MSDRRLRELAATPVLLVATDFDGTLAPIVQRPEDAEATPRARRALATLARQVHTRVAVISGRGLADLERRLGLLPEEGILLVGSHGSEFEPDQVGRLDASQLALRDEIRATLERVARDLPGVSVEHKDVSSCLHYRTADRDVATEALCRLRRARSELSTPVPATRRGKKVVEWLVIATHKGDAMERLRADLGATAVLFMGDDRTDEDAFASLGPGDLAVKVGEGTTVAELRVDGVVEAADLLARLADLRARRLREAVSVPIADMGFLSDRRTGALVTPAGEVCWLCPGRFDNPAMFASLLGGATAGRFVVRPADSMTRGHQRYRGDGMVLETRWPTLSVIDYLDGEAAGSEGGTVLVRDIIPHQPDARCAIEFGPRLDYGRADTVLAVEDGSVGLRAGVEITLLDCPGVTFEVQRMGAADVARAVVTLGAPLRLVLRCGPGTGTVREHGDVTAPWTEWADQLVLPSRWTDEVLRSALVLHGLCHEPSGSMVAALTTSLPEALGSERNWDYRYVWLRDASYAFDALLRLGALNDARDYLAWLCSVVEASDPATLRPFYTVAGGLPNAEAELSHLMGYAASRPVRIGNAAAGQLQVDVFGAVADLVYCFVEAGGAIDERLWRLVAAMVRAVSARWQEPDAGIWELRHTVRHHVHSKVMSWVAVDRASRLATTLDRPVPGEWTTLADAIREEVLERGWNEGVGAFTTAYDVPHLDAAALSVLLHGLIEPDDPRATSTVNAVMERLGADGTLYRYRFDDGLRGREGGFHICTSWLVEALDLIGRRAEAEHLFAEVMGAAGSTGILSEQVDPDTGAALGNVPQAYSHTGVIWNALTLSDDPRARRPG